MNVQVYTDFKNALVTCLNNRTYPTEDTIRYAFFASLITKAGLSASDIAQEYPHNTIPRAKIDTYIRHFNGQEVAIEFKYDREIPSGKNSPRPQKAGKLFNDMNRLLQFKTQHQALRLFVYLTDSEMAKYMRNPSNNLMDFFRLTPRDSLVLNERFFTNKSPTFQNSCGGILNATITCAFTASLPMSHEVKIFEIGSGNGRAEIGVALAKN